jgi:hypothetical protein
MPDPSDTSLYNYFSKVKAIRGQAYISPQDFRRLRLLAFSDIRCMKMARFQPHAPAAFTAKGRSWVLISVRG